MVVSTRWVVRVGGRAVAWLVCRDSTGGGLRVPLAEAAERADGASGLVEAALAMRIVTASPGHPAGSRVYELHPGDGAGAFDAEFEVGFPVGGGPGVTRLVSGSTGSTGHWYEALWSDRGGYAYVDRRSADGGITVLGVPGGPDHPMTMREAELAAGRLNDGIATEGPVVAP